MAGKGTIYIRKDLGVGFIPIPKNGSSTIRKIFFNWDPNKQDSLFSFTESPEILKENKTIAVISNPLVRFARGITEVLERKESKNRIRTHKFNNCLSDVCKVNAVIDQIEEIGFYDPHLKTQYHFISDEDDNILEIDEIWLLGELTEKIKELAPHYDGKREWTKGDKKDRFLKAIRGSKETKQRVLDLYHKDVELYLKRTGRNEVI